MSIRLACDECGKQLKIPDSQAGKTARCTGCGKPLAVPVPEEAAATASSAASIAKQLSKKTSAASGESPAGQKAPPKKKRRQFGDAEEKPKTSTAHTIAREFFLRYLPVVGGAVIAMPLLYWLMSLIVTTDRDLPELARVAGVVLLDQQPLQGATVTFHPETGQFRGDNVAASHGVTDEEGRFTLMYVKDVPGAAVGNHRVTMQVGSGGSRIVPPKYNSRSELTREVRPGRNEFTFELTSQAK